MVQFKYYTYNIIMTRPAMPTGASPPPPAEMKDFALTVNNYTTRKVQTYCMN